MNALLIPVSPPATPSVAMLLAFCILAEIARELFFKVGAKRADAAPIGYAVAVVRQPLVWCGVVAWGVEMVGWVRVLQLAPLGVAFPIMALTYAGVPLTSMLLLRERLNASQLAGAVLVVAGVACVGLSGR